MEEVASAVRIASPEPDLPEPPRKRDRSPSEGGPSKRPRERSPLRDDEDFRRGRDRPTGAGSRRDRENGRPPGRYEPLKEDDERLKLMQNAFSATRKLPLDDSKTRAGGTYIPPAKLRAMQAAITDKSSPEFQRMAWEALKKSIQGLINKCDIGNIKMIVPELFGENLVRGRGLFCRSIMKAQAASPPFTPMYAAMVAIVNTKLPQVGDLLVRRLIVQFRKSFKRNDKAVAVASSTFLAHLVNQQVVHEVLIAQILYLLLNKPTDDSVEIAVGVTKEVGQFLEEMNPPIAAVVFDQFRNILHEAPIVVRTQWMIEVLFQIRRDKYKDHPAIKEELDLVEEEDQITHRPMLDDDKLDVEDKLNVFKFDPEYEENEAAYAKLKAEILGEAEASDEEYTDASSEDEEEPEEKAMEIKDQTSAQLSEFRKTVYLTIKSSGGFEECCHKLMRINLPQGMEDELVNMIIECASQERTYEKFYGQIAERFCKLNRMWKEIFESKFVEYYEKIHRYETNRLRIISQLFAYLLATEAITWHVLSAIKVNEEDTTSSSRIFIKILFEELREALGQNTFVQRLKDPMLQESLTGIFPTDDEVNTRFSINFFTAIKMGVFTEGMREYLKNKAAQRAAAAAALPPPRRDAGSDTDSYSSRSRSRSRTPPRRRIASISRSRSRSYSSYSRSRSPPPRRARRSPSYSESPSRSPSRGRSRSMSRTPPRRRRNYSSSRSRSPPGRTRNARSISESVSRSPPRRHRHFSSLSRSPSPYSRRRRQSSSPPPRRGGPSSRSPSESVSPPRRHRNSSSPPRRRSPSPVRGRRDSSSLPPRRGPPVVIRRRDSSTPPPRRGSGPVRPRRDSSSPPPRRGPPVFIRRRDSSTPPRRRQTSSPPPRRGPPVFIRRRDSSTPPPRRGSHGAIHRRRDSSTPPPRRGPVAPIRRRDSSTPPPRRGSPGPVRHRRESASPPPRRGSPSPVRRRRDSSSPPPRRRSP